MWKTSTKPCPYCGKEIKSIAIKCQHCLKFLDKEQKKTKVCPFCLNEIDLNAQECSFCGENLIKKRKINKKWIILGILILLFGFIIFLIIKHSIWTNNSDLFEKKQLCLSYKDKILSWINEPSYIINNFHVFYSKKYDSCLYSYSLYRWKDTTLDWDATFYYIKDSNGDTTIYDCYSSYKDFDNFYFNENDKNIIRKSEWRIIESEWSKINESDLECITRWKQQLKKLQE